MSETDRANEQLAAAVARFLEYIKRIPFRDGSGLRLADGLPHIDNLRDALAFRGEAIAKANEPHCWPSNISNAPREKSNSDREMEYQDALAKIYGYKDSK